MNIPPETWTQIDRKALRQAVGYLHSPSRRRPLVVKGDDNSGREQAADVAAFTLRALGYDVIRVREQGKRPGSISHVLQSVWIQLESGGQPSNVVPESLATASREVNVSAVLAKLPELCKALSDPPAFVLDTIDPQIKLILGPLLRLRELGNLGPLVVLARAETRTRFPHSFQSFTLRDMEVSDIISSLTADSATIDPTKVELIREELLAEADDGQVDSFVAYSCVQQHLAED